jgi:2-polyprenyl-3-methyl-5-hydroxy-6-metoxy-1,4-benzoquinol methylase
LRSESDRHSGAEQQDDVICFLKLFISITEEDETMNTHLAMMLCDLAQDYINLPPAPIEIQDALPSALEQVERISKLATFGTHAEYFKVSKNRYAHYLALATQLLPANSRILDVGNAPGHFAHLLTQCGHRVTGVNLNDEWRKTYPDPSWISDFDVRECDIEREELPFPDSSFDAVLFTEVLEHIAISDPVLVLRKLRRVLNARGLVIFSTPNVCNLSNIIALTLGKNIFWPENIFYGSLDRHNREWTPAEAQQLFIRAGFGTKQFYGMSDHSNWRFGAAESVYQLLGTLRDDKALLLNTIVGAFAVE